MRRRAAAILGALTVLVAGLALSQTTAQAAGGTISPWSSSVAVGASFSAGATGCSSVEQDTDEGFSYQEPQLLLISGTGAGERMAAFGEQVDDHGRYRFTVPGWVDPALPAVVAGRCLLTTYVETEQGASVTTTTVFTYPDVAVDITPGTASPTGPVVSVDRSTAAGGQVVTVTGSQCQGDSFAEVVLFAGTDLSGRTAGNYVTGTSADIPGSGTFTSELALNQRGTALGNPAGGPLPEGDYTLMVVCERDDEESSFAIGELLPLTVAGTNPSGDFTAEVSDGMIHAMGSGCTGGQAVTVNLTGYAYSYGIEEVQQRASRALARRSIEALADDAVDPDGSIQQTLTAVPDADGNWSVEGDAPEGSFDLVASADCGDPTGNGFRYVTRYLYENDTADLYVERASPTSSPTGGSVMLSVGGFCDGTVAVAIVDSSRNVISQSDPIVLDAQLGSGTVTAPTTPGRYGIAGVCDDQLGYAEEYQVFTPDTVSAEAPLPAEPTEGWPSQGERETYHGKIGPIDLPAMDMDGMDMAKAAKDLDPSGLFIKVPRPDGDFAITKLSFDLVDAEGMPVDQEHAHLHHFVIANTAKENPACPDGTFGLPGQIVGAAGAERTVLQTGDPYGLVVKDTDTWSGVYELMSRSMEDQKVYLTYDIDYRRDVQNVRPVTSYFGSATGCDTYTWTVDGSGTPDTQSHYLTIAKSGRLIGAGGHIHNGGAYADLVNDRGRRLCRSEITYGDEPVGHTMDLRSSSRPLAMVAEATTTSMPMSTTTAVGPIDPTDEYPPEFYDDDLAIKGISTCALSESVTAGERLRFDAVYTNDRSRSGVMGIYTAYVWEGGGPAEPGPGGADPIPGNPSYTG